MSLERDPTGINRKMKLSDSLRWQPLELTYVGINTTSESYFDLKKNLFPNMYSCVVVH